MKKHEKKMFKSLSYSKQGSTKRFLNFHCYNLQRLFVEYLFTMNFVVKICNVSFDSIMFGERNRYEVE